jgi:uncharacterized protein YwqG
MNRIKEILKRQNLLDEEIEFYTHFSRPTLLLNLGEKENYQATGNCRIGGWPDLPKGYQYPSNYDDKLYVFVAQINLAKVDGKIDLGLPKVGMLYFFLISDEDDSQNIKHLVWYNKSDDLVKYSPPENFQFCTTIYNSEFPSYKLEFKESRTINSNHFIAKHWQNINADGEINELIYPSSRIGGHSYSSDGDVVGNIIYEKGELGKYERNLISKGYPFIDLDYIVESNKWIENQLQELKITKSITSRHQKESIIRDYREEQKAYKNLVTKKEKIRIEFDKWKLLISIDSIDELNMCWWDLGSLEYYINEDDLKNMDFTNTHCIINNAG